MDTKGTGGHRDTPRTGGHSGGIGRDTKRAGGNNGGIGAGRKATGTQHFTGTVIVFLIGAWRLFYFYSALRYYTLLIQNNISGLDLISTPLLHLTALEEAEMIPGKHSDTRIKPLTLTNGHGC
jgi:hypothetical protein